MFLPITALHNEGLPIFHLESEGYTLFYVPGYLVIVPLTQVNLFARNLLMHSPNLSEAHVIRQQAQQVVQTWHVTQSAPFAPVCLTLYLNNQCNLRCVYCYAAATPFPSLRLSLEAITAAAHIVAQNCVQQQQSMTLVCHGGGEPTLDQPYLKQVLGRVEAVASQYDLPLFRYIATNGLMPSSTAQFLAKRFDLIGLSCDGPESIQATQRPTWGSQNSTHSVEKTAHIIRDQGAPLHVRVTLTPQSITQQVAIAHYLAQNIQPDEIHVEPVYKAGRASLSFKPEQADLFVAEFWKAQAVAQQYGIRWVTSGSRPQELHGPYCHIQRQVLNLIPGDVATACFKKNRAMQAHQDGVQIGQSLESLFVIDTEQVDSVRRILSPWPDPCRRCFNRFHCARDCPDNCPLDGEANDQPTFRCRVQRKLSQMTLEAAAAKAFNQSDRNTIIGLKIQAVGI